MPVPSNSFTVDHVLQATEIPIPSTFNLGLKKSMENLCFITPLCENSFPIKDGNKLVTSSLASVLLAKKNSYSVSYPFDNSIFIDEDDVAFTEPNTSPLSSSPESAFSDFSYYEDNNSSFLYTNSNKSLSRSRLSSVTSLSSADDNHPLSQVYFRADQSQNSTPCPAPSKSPEPSEKSNTNFVSNLTQTFKKLRANTTPLGTFVAPINYAPFFVGKPDVDTKPPKEVALKTFNIKTIPLVENWDLNDSLSNVSGAESSGYSTCRSIRSSPLFLKLYAIENVAQHKRLIPNIFDVSAEEHDCSFDDEEEDGYEYLNSKEYLDLGDKAKLKLFNHIKLQPRTDLPINNNLKNVTYVSMSNTTSTPTDSLIQNFQSVESQNIAPWIQFNDMELLNRKKGKQFTLNTHGFLKNNIQFTVKGYCNPRWLHQD